MSIQEVNGKGPKKRKKSLERICDNEERETASVPEPAREEPAPAAGAAGPARGVELLHWRDMPQHLQFNPYVLTGYRPLQSWAGCVGSLFYFHNETINILTHGNVPHLFIPLFVPGTNTSSLMLHKDPMMQFTSALVRLRAARNCVTALQRKKSYFSAIRDSDML